MISDMTAPTAGRIRSIDQFRGFAILLMAVFNYFYGIETLPAWLKHVPDIGMNFPDLGTPVFIFAIGLTYGLSFQRRVKKTGLGHTIAHFIRRYLSFIGIGAIITAGQTILGRQLDSLDWGVLQSIGAAGLITLLVISLPTRVRFGAGIVLLALYQILLDRYWLDLILGSQHGGLPGSISWGAILILATVLGDIFHSSTYRKYFPWVAVLFIIGGFGLAIWVPVSKIRVSASYDLITLGSSGLVFWIFFKANYRLDFFEAWGQNPLLLYLLSFLVSAIFVLPKVPGWYTQAPIWLVSIQALVLVLILSGLALYWKRKGFIFSM